MLLKTFTSPAPYTNISVLEPPALNPGMSLTHRNKGRFQVQTEEEAQLHFSNPFAWLHSAYQLASTIMLWSGPGELLTKLLDCTPALTLESAAVLLIK